MSLDVHLEMPGTSEGKVCPRCGKELPGEPIEVFEANITHNLNRMADAAGIYDCVWRPEEHGITHAKQLIEPLTAGLAMLKQNPVIFAEYNPKNGWGDYDGLVRWVSEYLNACVENPDAMVRARR